MVSTPAILPETMPEPSIVAIAVLLLVQRPPVVVTENVPFDVTQTLVGPEIVDGFGFTVIVAVTMQPFVLV